VQGRQGIRPLTHTTVVGAIDIGGTHVTAGRVDTGSRSVAARTRVALPTAGARSELLEEILRAAVSIARPDVDRLGVAVPGPFDYSTGVSRIAHKLRGLYGVDLRTELCAALRFGEATAVRFLNDADAFVLGEWWAGAARGHARVVGITLGTGLGSSFIDAGRVVESPAGRALYELPFRGAPVEQTISSGGVRTRYRGADAEGIDAVDIAARANEGDPEALRAFEELGQALGEFLHPFLRAFRPGCLVVGGSIARSWELFAGALRAQLEPIESLEAVTAAEHLEDAPLLGAGWHVAVDQL
jgi:glucokinase